METVGARDINLGLVGVVTKTGLGYQGLSLARALSPSKILVPDISEYNGYAQNPEWYPNGIFIKGFPTIKDIDNFVDNLDVIIVTESAYNDYLYACARRKGVIVINQFNWEFFGWHTMPLELTPNAFISPSMWHYEDVQLFCDNRGLSHTYLHCPVDRQSFPFRKITKVKRFIHSGGRSAAHDRAGTFSVIDASRYLQSDAEIIIHFQGEQGLAHQQTSTSQDYIEYAKRHGNMTRLKFVFQDMPHPSDIYELGDVYLQPRRYGGNNLCMGEALSCGLPIIMTDISPNDSFLPKHWLVPATKIGEFTPRITIDIYEADARALAAKIDWFASLDEQEMIWENQLANTLAESISWPVMLPKYQEFINQCLR